GAAEVAAGGGWGGGRKDPGGAAGIPNVDLDVRVAQSSSVISELRLSLSMNDQTIQLLVSLSNPGDPVQIVPPPPGLVDDLTGGGNTILGTVGNEIQTEGPAEPQLSPPPPPCEWRPPRDAPEPAPIPHPNGPGAPWRR